MTMLMSQLQVRHAAESPRAAFIIAPSSFVITPA